MEINVGEVREAVGRGSRSMHIASECGHGIIDGLGVAPRKRLKQGRDVGVDVVAAAVAATSLRP
jgi:hypothetical protein